jgi:hypothetical protein
MPVLTLQLDQDGPIIRLLVGVSAPRETALKQANQPVPQPVAIRALLDTGASCSCIVASALTPLALQSTGTAQVNTPSTGNVPMSCSQYDVSLTVLHPHVNFLIPAMPIVECQSLSGNYQALLGRDFLALALFVYDGPADRFSLGY